MVLFDVVVDVLAERVLGVGELDTVLRALRARDGWHDVAQIEFEVLGELGLAARVVPHPLRLGVGLHQRQLVLVAARQPQIVDGDLIDRENRCGGTELRAHVAQRGAVGQRHLGHALTVELDELADHAVLAEHVGDGQHDVGGGYAGLDLPGQLEADDAGDEHGDRLAEHRRLGLDAADTPAEHAEAVDHRGVAVGADTGVGVGHLGAVALADHDGASQVLDVDLMHDAGAGGDDLEVVEGALAPAQKLVALAVALVLDLDVAFERVGAAEDVHDDGVVDHELSGGQRIHLVDVPAQVTDRLAHGGQVDDAGHAGEVLHDHAGRRELDLDARVGRRVPIGDRVDVVLGDVGAVFGAQQVLREHLEAVGKFLRPGNGVEAVDLVTVVPHLERVACSERVHG